MRAPRQQEPDHVAKIMSGIREQRDRVREHPVNDLDHHQRDIEGRRDRKNATEIRRRVRVGMSRMRVPGVGMSGVIVRHASHDSMEHGQLEAQPQTAGPSGSINCRPRHPKNGLGSENPPDCATKLARQHSRDREEAP